MRQRAPFLTIALCLVVMVSHAMANVPTNRQASIPTISSNTIADAQQRVISPADPHPFSTEFYMQQFADEPMPTDIRQQHSSWLSPVFSPVTNAASSLSKRVATLRHALVRMMP